MGLMRSSLDMNEGLPPQQLVPDYVWFAEA